MNEMDILTPLDDSSSVSQGVLLLSLLFFLLTTPRLNDLVGSDVGLHVGKNFLDAFPDRVHVSHLIPLLNQHKRLGEKTGKGFYQVRDLYKGNLPWVLLLHDNCQ